MINIAFFSAKPYDEKAFSGYLEQHKNEINCHYFDIKLDIHTVELAREFDAVCVFVNDDVNRDVLSSLASMGVKHVALRCAGFNQVDLSAAEEFGVSISRVPAYSPEAVAEHTVGLMLTLNRKLHKAYNRVRDGNFELNGLLGFTLHSKTVGVIGTGRIGLATVKILCGFGCNVLCYDVEHSDEIEALGAKYVTLDSLLSDSDIVTLHCPLNGKTHHMINDDSLASMKDNVMLVNTSRGGLVDTSSAIKALKSGKIGYFALDVYEMESDLFFRDLSNVVIQDDIFARLSRFHNVLITGHQGFFTQEALDEIAHTTVENILRCDRGQLESPYKVCLGG